VCIGGSVIYDHDVRHDSRDQRKMNQNTQMSRACDCFIVSNVTDPAISKSKLLLTAIIHNNMLKKKIKNVVTSRMTFLYFGQSSIKNFCFHIF